MPVLATARCSRFLDYQGNEYPGFINLSCNYTGLDQSGLITWEGTAEIAWVPGNPTNIDNRKNKVTWCFGRVVDLRVVNDSGNYERPKCIPKMYIYKALYNPHTERLRLELRDILGLLRDKSIDDFRNDFEEENDIETEIPEEEKEKIEACGFPGEEDYDETKFNDQQNKKKDKFWWEQWQKEGTEQNIIIISEIMRRLEISIQGTVMGSIRLPYTVSGSLLSACGDLAFKSLTPSYIWSNYAGRAIISRINIDPPREKFYVSGVDDIDYSPVENGLNPISELIVLGRVKELDENAIQEETIEDEDGNIVPMHCETITETGPETLINSDGDALANIDVVKTKICEFVTRFKKTITTDTEERYGSLFPESTDTDNSPSEWIRSYKKIEEQFYDACTGSLLKKVVTEYNVWGKVFGAYYGNHLDYVIDPLGFGQIDIGITQGLISPYSDLARYDTTLIRDKTETTRYYYKKQKLYKTTVQTEEPKYKILVDFAEPRLSNDIYSGYAITSSSVETWSEWGNSHQTHTLVESDALNRVNSAAVQREEERLAKTLADYGEDIPAFEQQVYSRFYSVDATDPNSVQVPSIRFNTVMLPKSLVSYKKRLALTGKRTVSESSREGLANAPATEYLPRGKASEGSEANEVNKNATEKWIDKPVVYRKKWENAKGSEFLPSREITDLGEVITGEIVNAVGEVIYYLRQGQSYIHELILPFTQDWISGSFKPTFRVDVKECEDAYCHLAHGISMDFSQKENSLLMELLWLGETSVSTPISSPQKVLSYNITSLPPSGEGVLYLEGVAVTSGQEIPAASISNLTFIPTTTFSGATFSYVASGGIEGTPTPVVSPSALTVQLIPKTGVALTIPTTNPNIPPTVASTVVIDNTVIENKPITLPIDLESNSIPIVKVVEDDFTYSYQLKTLLRRLKSNTIERLTLQSSDRTKIYL
jgi:hypothetical protein